MKSQKGNLEDIKKIANHLEEIGLYDLPREKQNKILDELFFYIDYNASYFREKIGELKSHEESHQAYLDYLKKHNTDLYRKE